MCTTRPPCRVFPAGGGGRDGEAAGCGVRRGGGAGAGWRGWEKRQGGGAGAGWRDEVSGAMEQLMTPHPPPTGAPSPQGEGMRSGRQGRDVSSLPEAISAVIEEIASKREPRKVRRELVGHHIEKAARR